MYVCMYVCMYACVVGPSCKSLHTLHLMGTEVTDVSAFASCQSLHTGRMSRAMCRCRVAMGSHVV
jgi:hypothetical protein